MGDARDICTTILVISPSSTGEEFLRGGGNGMGLSRDQSKVSGSKGNGVDIFNKRNRRWTDKRIQRQNQEVMRIYK